MKIGLDRMLELLDAGVTFTEAYEVIQQENKQRKIADKAAALDHLQ